MTLGRILLLLLASSAVFAQAPTPAPAPAVAPGAPAVTAPAAQTVNPDQYIVGPGDTLQVFVWRNPELTATVPVRPDGKISTPLVEDMVAVGKNPSALARDIEKVLAEYVRAPTVNVIVTQPVGAFGQVQVIGQVTRPGSLPFRSGMKLLDAVLAVGGVSQFAAGNRTKVVRSTPGAKQEFKVKLDNLLNKGDMSQNLPLQPGDVIVVPESRF
ncbi:MAG TPA: XrtA/PEP-CTERM system exopolysaccharide export protein [Steroidobacteraceae bacterium]